MLAVDVPFFTARLSQACSPSGIINYYIKEAASRRNTEWCVVPNVLWWSPPPPPSTTSPTLANVDMAAKSSYLFTPPECFLFVYHFPNVFSICAGNGKHQERYFRIIRFLGWKLFSVNIIVIWVIKDDTVTLVNTDKLFYYSIQFILDNLICEVHKISLSYLMIVLHLLRAFHHEINILRLWPLF